MDKDNLHLTIFIVLCVVASVAIALGIDAYQNRSKFKEGDCIQKVYDFEFKDSTYYYEIVKVGEKMYLTNQKVAGGDRFFSLNSQEWKFELNKYDKTERSNCEVLK